MSRSNSYLLSIAVFGVLQLPAYLNAEKLRVFEGQYLVQEETRTRAGHRKKSTYLVSTGGSFSRSSKTQVIPYDKQAHRKFCKEQRKENPHIKYCEPNAELRIQTLASDPIPQSAMSQISAPSAWELTTGSESVVVSILDTGGDYTHEDLKENIWVNPGEIAADGIDNDGNGFIDDIHGIDLFNKDSDPQDDNGHGTHVGGTIGARGNNAVGVTGVAWSVKLQFVKFIGTDGAGSTFSAVKGIEYAVSTGANIINASWGGPFPSDILRDSIAEASKQGVIFVTAAGNSGSDNDITQHYPAGYGAEEGLPVLAVAAVDGNDELAFFSNYGRGSVHIAAPGMQIMSTLPGNMYGALSGTSMAAPHVAGAAALLLSYKPGLSFEEVKSRLLAGGDRSNELLDAVTSGARLNVARTLSADTSPSSAIPVFLSRVPGRISKRLIPGRTLYFGFSGAPNSSSSASLVLEDGVNSYSCEFPYTLDANGYRLLRTRLHLSEGVSVQQAKLVGALGGALSQPVKVSSSESHKTRLLFKKNSRRLKKSCKRILRTLRNIRLF